MAYAQAQRNRFDARLWFSGRFSTAYGSKGAALGAIAEALSDRMSLEVSGGSLLPGPYQGFPRSAFVTAGVRVRLGRVRPPPAGAGPLSVSPRGIGGVVLRLRQRATSVAIAGDWNGWTRTPLEAAGTGEWEIALPLSRGTYHYLLFIDDVPWTIPPAVPSIPDGLGGRVAVLTVF